MNSDRSQIRRRALVLLFVALAARLALQTWDSGLLSPHPDERQVAFVAEKMTSWSSDPDFYAYGSLHFQTVRAAAFIGSLPRTYAGLLVSGRTLSFFASMMAILIGWWLARRAWGQTSAEVFVLLVALCPLDLQLSHYATVEAHHALWVMLTIAAAYWNAVSSRPAASLLMGAALGFSVAVKIASLPLGLGIVLSLIIAGRTRSWLRPLQLAALAGASAVMTFYIGQPTAFTDLRPPTMLIGALLIAFGMCRHAETRDGSTRFSQQSSSAAGDEPSPAAFSRIGMLDGRSSTTPRPSGRKPHWARRLPVLVTNIGEKCGFLRTILIITSFLSFLIAGAVLTITVFGLDLTSVVPQLNPDYLRGLREQISMVSGRSQMPYVRIYNPTQPFLYVLRELGVWALGPALLTGAFLAGLTTFRLLIRRWRRLLHRSLNESTILLILIFAWIVPMALRLATLQVKFIRYWELMVVPLCLLASWWLVRLPKKIRRPAIIISGFITLLWGLMYLWAFTTPHPHHSAARWLETMVEEDQVIAFEHWDESLGLHPPWGQVGTTTLPSYDLPDDEKKARRWCESLDEADWVVLTSNRVRRTTMVNPALFPRTARLYELLLEGEAGFEVLGKADRAPRFFGYHRSIQEADESLVNYDFPRVVILRRTGVTNIEKLVAASGSGGKVNFHYLESRLIDPLPSLPHRYSAAAQIVAAGSWLALFVAIALASWVLLLPLLRSFADGGIGLAMISGWLFCSWLMWFGSEIGLFSTGEKTASMIVFALVLCASLVGWQRRTMIMRILHRRAEGMKIVAGFGGLVWLFFLLLRLFNPAIFWGEKPMDFAFLNAFLNASQWPPGEPWMAGEVLNYYYLGDVLAAFPILATGVGSAIGFNLIVATIPAVSATLLASLGLTFAQQKIRGLLLPILVLLTGNLAWPFLLDLASNRRWFDMWWATSRVIPGFAIEEFPLWTSVFADLHGHFLASPVVFAGLAWGWLCVRCKKGWPITAFMCALSAAVLAGTNPWDILLFASTLGLATISIAGKRLRGLARLSAAGALSVVLAAPFLVELAAWMQSGTSGPAFFLNGGEMAPAWAIGRHLGLFLIPLAALAMTRLGKDAFIVIGMVLAAVFTGMSFHSSAAALALATASLFFVVLSRSSFTLERLMWCSAGLAMLAVAFCERFTLFDRMNTIFKIYNSVWWLLCFALTIAIITSKDWRRKLVLAVWIPLQIVAMVNLPLAIGQGVLQPRTRSPRPTFDGQAFLEKRDPQTWFLTRALQGMAGADDVILEAAGDPYREFTRLAMHTGLTTVVGWEHHLFQRGHPREAIYSRFADVMAFYTTIDPSYRRLILDRYDVDWIALADVERRRYDLKNDHPIEDTPGLVRVASEGGAVLYRVLR